MDALDCANFSSERTCRTESSATNSTYFTATHHAEPITATFPFTVPDDFSNKANFTNATADADSLNLVEIDECSEATRVCGRERRRRRDIGQVAGLRRGSAQRKGGLG